MAGKRNYKIKDDTTSRKNNCHIKDVRFSAHVDYIINSGNDHEQNEQPKHYANIIANETERKHWNKCTHTDKNHVQWRKYPENICDSFIVRNSHFFLHIYKEHARVKCNKHG